MNDNIFIHDAVPTWSGFLYQGQIAVQILLERYAYSEISGTSILI